ncbi:MAG: XRE family transcriptional regulator [Proteobacteria bacterium]|nr:XRE family transcriptional regulator [Pseudomonadota bacterium]
MSSDTPSHLATNARLLREARGLTQQQVAEIAELPRPTWATLESGSANPTLGVLMKAAAALQVSIEELIGPPRTTGTVYRADSLRTRRRGTALVRSLVPETIPGLEIERIELPANGHMNGTPHTPGTREYLTCERGQVQLVAGGETYVLAPGDMLVFRGDQRHSYRNPRRERAIAVSVVAFAPRR